MIDVPEVEAQEYEAPKLEIIGSVTELTLEDGSLGDFDEKP